MKRMLIPILLVALSGGCGSGKWGASVSLSVSGVDAHGDTLASGETLILSEGGWTLTLDRACLAVELAVITPAASEGEADGEDCFCHGDPPECHGDCSGATDGGVSLDLVAEVDAVVDLLDGPTGLSTRGAAPGDYARISLVLGGDHAEPLPTACADTLGSTLFVQGTLTNTATSETWTLTVDLREEVVTEPMAATPAATATTEAGGTLLTSLRLDHALDHVDFAAVTTDATGAVTIGGANEENHEAADEIVHGLTHAESYGVTGATAE